MARSERFELRVSPEWLEALDGGRGSLSRAGFVVQAVEKALGSSGVAESRRDVESQNSTGLESQRSPGLPDPSPRAPASPRVSEPQKTLLRCPVVGCDFAASSPNAICNAHGKKVR
jgi:hypothetical protein